MTFDCLRTLSCLQLTYINSVRVEVERPCENHWQSAFCAAQDQSSGTEPGGELARRLDARRKGPDGKAERCSGGIRGQPLGYRVWHTPTPPPTSRYYHILRNSRLMTGTTNLSPRLRRTQRHRAWPLAETRRPSAVGTRLHENARGDRVSDAIAPSSRLVGPVPRT